MVDTHQTELPFPTTDSDRADRTPTVTHSGIAGALQRLARADPAWWVLLAMIVVWSIVFGVLVWQRHDRYGSFSFDMGIFDQAVWLLSRGGDQLITVRGLTVFGHHSEPALYLMVPFYWLGAGPHFLNILQVLSMALGAVPVFLLARYRLLNSWLAVALGAVYLLQPSLQFMAWELFHPEVMGMAPLMFAYYFSVRREWTWFALCAVLAVAWKEDLALAVLVLGIIIAFRGDRKIGLITVASTLAYFLFVTRIMLPHFSGSEAFYTQFFSDLGDSPGEMVKNAVTHPSLVTRRLVATDARDYLWKMVAPFAFLPLAALGPAAIGLPQVLVNLMSVNDFTRKITYHYAAIPLAALTIATVEGIRLMAKWFGNRDGVKHFLVGLVVVTSFMATVAWGPSPLGREFRKGWWPGAEDSRKDTKAAALAVIPPGAPVSATYLFVPHLTHRDRIYEFPNPFKPKNWGVRDENYPPATNAEWLAVDRQLLGPEDRKIFDDEIESGRFQVVFDSDDIVVARRVRGPDGSGDAGR